MWTWRAPSPCWTPWRARLLWRLRSGSRSASAEDAQPKSLHTRRQGGPRSRRRGQRASRFRASRQVAEPVRARSRKPLCHKGLYHFGEAPSRGNRPPVSAAGVPQLLDRDLELFDPAVVVLLRLLARSRGRCPSGRAQVRFERSPPSVIELHPLERAEEGPALGHEPAIDQRPTQCVRVATRRKAQEVVDPRLDDRVVTRVVADG